LETGQHILAGFQTNIKKELLDVGIASTSHLNFGNSQSKKERIMARVLQPDILANLKLSLETYMNRNDLTEGQVGTICIHLFLIMK